MTAKEVSFSFSKELGSMNLCHVKTQYNQISIDMPSHCANKAAIAMSEVFNKLIAKDASKYQPILLSLGAFSVTILNPASEEPSLQIGSTTQEHLIYIKKLKTETAALFLTCLPSHSSNIISLKTPTEQEMYTSLKSGFESFFSSLQIQSSSQIENFGTFLIERVFGKPELCHIDYKTRSFTLTFAEEKNIPITNLPEGRSPEFLAAYKELLNSSLHIAKIVKGKIENSKISFERGSLKFDWKWTSAYLLDISEHPVHDNALIIKGQYLKTSGDIPLLAQDFVDFIECNLPKNTQGTTK